jgi:hypothetical protein
MSIFDFTKKFLTLDGAMFLFYMDDPWVLKDIKSYLESYNF